jgi:hypothetical protein
MAEIKNYDCDLCGRKAKDAPNPEAGVSVLFETDCSGNVGATISLLGAVKGMAGLGDAKNGEFAKVVNICEPCRLAIANPEHKSKWCKDVAVKDL